MGDRRVRSRAGAEPAGDAGRRAGSAATDFEKMNPGNREMVQRSQRGQGATEEPPSPPLDGGEGRGEEGHCVTMPLSSVLSPLLRRGEKRKRPAQKNLRKKTPKDNRSMNPPETLRAVRRSAWCACSSPSPRDEGVGRGRGEGSPLRFRWRGCKLRRVRGRIAMIRDLSHDLDAARAAMQGMPDFQQHAFAIIPPLPIPKPQFLDAFHGQKLLARLIALPLPGHAVRKAVQFNRKPGGGTVEIEKIFPGRMLTPELEAGKTPRPQFAPKFFFLGSLLTPETPRVCCLIHPSDNNAVDSKDKQPLSP